METRSNVIPQALNYPYRPLSCDEVRAGLVRAGIDLPYRGYVLHVGSGLRAEKPRGARCSGGGDPRIPGRDRSFSRASRSSAGRARAGRICSAWAIASGKFPGADNETLLALYAAARKP